MKVLNKYRYLMSLAFFAALLIAQSDYSVAISDTSLFKEFRNREYILEIPTGKRSDRPRPLILVLHGALSNAAIVRRRLNNHMRPLIEDQKIMVAYMNGIGRRAAPQIKRWNVGDFVDRGKPDDGEYLEAFIRYAIKRYNANPKRIYILGHSNGAMMAYKFVCENPGRIAAIVAVSGTLTIPECEPDSTKGVLHIHGMRDRVIPVRGPRRLLIGPFRPKFQSVDITQEIIEEAGIPFRLKLLREQGHSMRRIDRAINLPATAWNYLRSKRQ